ncbi:FadR/GntR family transcriptional regulator [Bacillus sp. B1-b2]|uniref:FadR/GntR family transcriptional regulator n=1 Tax=Bacillus sp. B1-b2 TaxID=2653201 RepID=UPI0012613EDA|nr:FadR/GntR family transcriptional regulator [Bacillus sp. B1-b2]KAB7667749.1 FadR family transcriptional regulator [Bacillus sp. B1-b2]
MALESIKKRSLYEEIVSSIILYIQKENIKPGEKLPSENELMEYFKVSKTAVREALSVLAARGIIEKKPGVGSILKETSGATFIDQMTNKLIVDKHALQDILEFRRGVEVEATALAAERASPEQLEAIEKAHLKLIEVNKNGETGIKEDFTFHQLIILASCNSMYERIFDFIAPYYLEALTISKNQSKQISDRYFKESHEEHQRIIQAIKGRNPERARAYALEHLLNNETKVWSHTLPI